MPVIVWTLDVMAGAPNTILELEEEGHTLGMALQMAKESLMSRKLPFQHWTSWGFLFIKYKLIFSLSPLFFKVKLILIMIVIIILVALAHNPVLSQISQSPVLQRILPSVWSLLPTHSFMTLMRGRLGPPGPRWHTCLHHCIPSLDSPSFCIPDSRSFPTFHDFSCRILNWLGETEPLWKQRIWTRCKGWGSIPGGRKRKQKGKADGT